MIAKPPPPPLAVNGRWAILSSRKLKASLLGLPRYAPLPFSLYFAYDIFEEKKKGPFFRDLEVVGYALS